MQSIFSRINKDYASEMSNLATHRGIEHELYESDLSGGPLEDYVTFKFTNPRAKRAFEHMCLENGLDLDQERAIQVMLDRVADGESPGQLLEGMSRKKPRTKHIVTRGMFRSLGKQRAKYYCSSCELQVPSYPGRYPHNCPDCGSKLKSK